MPMADPRIRPDMSLIYAILAIIVICCLLVGGELFIEPRMSQIMADTKLTELEGSFETLNHPPGSQIVSKYSLAGEFTGEKQGCDYFIGEIRSAPVDKVTIQMTYASQKMDGRPFEVALLENTTSLEQQLNQIVPETISNPQNWPLNPGNTNEQTIYIIYLLMKDTDRQYDCR